jgi:hypothetical protein
LQKTSDEFIDCATPLDAFEVFLVEGGRVGDCLAVRRKDIVALNSHDVQARVNVCGAGPEVLALY